jgi:hypothetical protein
MPVELPLCGKQSGADELSDVAVYTHLTAGAGNGQARQFIGRYRLDQRQSEQLPIHIKQLPPLLKQGIVAQAKWTV